MAIVDDQIAHAKLDAARFNDEIAAHGIDVTLKQGTRCPCFNEETGQPDPNCTACEGYGTIWNAGSTVRVWGPNRRFNRSYEQPGTIDLGDAMFSFQAGTFVAHLDRMILPSEIIVVSETLTKGATNAFTGITKEKARFATIITPVERAVWTQRNPASGFPYTITSTDLIEGTDFSIINGNQVNWLAGGAPPTTGARYSIRFRTNAEYLIWSPRGRSEGTQDLPYQYLAKRIDFIRGPA